jgi:hypothetical protein
MKIIKFTIILCIAIICENTYCQEDTINVIRNNDQFLRQKTNNTNDIPKDTIKLFLDDNSYYISLDDENFFEKIKTYSSYLNSGHFPSYILSEHLPDGYYCLYSLKKKQAKKTKNIDEYIVASGEYKNGMKQGAFYFKFIPENSKWVSADKVIYFKDDVVNGAVIERERGNIMFLGEYQMGIKHGFFYYYNGGAPSIVLYENGVKVKDSTFW